MPAPVSSGVCIATGCCRPVGDNPVHGSDMCSVHGSDVYRFFLWLSGPRFDHDRDGLELRRA